MPRPVIPSSVVTWTNTPLILGWPRVRERSSRGKTEIGAISRQAVYDSLGVLVDKGIIRRIGANFQSAKIGFKSTLCAASVPEDRLEAFTRAVNDHPGVTHNYLRDHPINIWFTMIGPSREAWHFWMKRAFSARPSPGRLRSEVS